LTNSTAPVTACTIVSGALPQGIGVQPNGAGCIVFGTPAVAATTAFSVSVSNNQGQTTPAQSLILSVFGITSPSSLPSAIKYFPYSYQFQANSASRTIQWSLVSGTIPSGLLLSAAGVLSGTPQSSGLFQFTLSVVDLGTGLTDSRAFSLA